MDGSGFVEKPTQVCPKSFPSPGRITAVGEDRLAGDPPSIGHEEFYDRNDVLDFGELAIHALRLVICDGIRRFNRIEERRIHRSGGNICDRDSTRTEFLRRCARKVFHWRFATRIGGVEPGKRSQ